MSRVLLTIPGYIGTQSGFVGRLFLRRGTGFRASGLLGLVCAVGVTATLATHLSLSIWLVFWILLSTIAIFFGRMLVNRLKGSGQHLVFYHYLITLIGLALILSWLSGQRTCPI